MQIAYFAPLERAFARMKQILFGPFDLVKWLVIGFGCWLAELTSSSGGGGGSGWRMESGDDAQALLAATRAPDWMPPVLSGLAAWLVISLVLAVLGLLLLFTWLSSRGRFLFLDNVLHDRGAIKAPWKEYSREGNSLFLWNLGFFAVCLVLFAVALAPFILSLVTGEEAGKLAGLFLTLPLGLVLVLAIAYTRLFLVDFVVPLQLKERLTTMEAWRRFLPLLRRHLGHFLLYGLFVLLLWLLVAAAILVLGFATCCFFIVLVILPYVGTVVLLPVYTTFRALSLEFFAQFGPDYDLFATVAPPIPPAPEEGGEPATVG